jgi:hypothetical protein
MYFSLVLTAVVLGGAKEETPKSFAFVKRDLGKVPAGWTATQTGKGKGSVWKVVADETAPSKSGLALAQTAESPSQLFNLCVVNDGRFRDVELSVAFKAVAGEKDQGGGLVWRYQDHDNYYVARMNPLEDNFRLYKVVDGRRIQLQTTKDDVKVPVGTWHVLRIRHTGEIGLWTKADAQTYFDHLTVQALSNKKD